MVTWQELSPVAKQQVVIREAGGMGKAEVEVRCSEEGRLIPGHPVRALSAAMRRRGSGKDARHHVESEEDLGQADPYVQNLLIFSEAPDCGEELFEIHCGKRRSTKQREGKADG